MQTVIKAADAADFLALVPALAGYRPTQSLALVLFQGTRTVGVMRFDLLPDAAADDIDSYASTAIGLACKVSEVDGLAVVIYTDAAFRGPARNAPVAGEPIVDAIELRAHACGLRIVDALCVAADAWGSYRDPDQPWGGRPLSEVTEREGDVPIPVPRADQADDAALPHADLAQKERVGNALVALDDATRLLLRSREDARPAADPPLGSGSETVRGVADLDPRALAAVCALDDVPQLFEDALARPAEELDPFAAAALIWCLSRPALRDVALCQWCDDLAAGDAAMAAQIAWEDGADYPEAGARRFMGEGPRPDPARLTRARDLVRWVAALAPRPLRPGALSAAAWLSWALGRSTHAAWYCDRALEIDPEHGMSQIVRTMVGAAHLPEWAFERP